MEKKKIIKEYKKDDLVVVWQPDICIHSKNCIHGLPGVFNFNRRPWIDPNEAPDQAIKNQIDNCPSGALSYYLQSEGKPKPKTMVENANTIEILKDGPIMVEGPCVIKNADGNTEEKTKKTFLCRCGASSNKPYCDGSHKKAGFTG
jgi:uncharacterized Fe-S cluster protein YjdI